jgi:Cu+-exporting ATPase
MDKLEYVEYHQNQGSKILMIGDGLNDAGALAQSDVGISLSEDINTFSPACDGILHASNFEKIAAYLQFCKQAYSVLKFSYIISIVYNIIGLYFAITGQLEPIVAAILMPLSSISIVVFTSLATNYSAKQLKRF